MNDHRIARLLGVALLLAGLGGCRAFHDWLMGTPESIRQYRTAKTLFEKERYEEAGVAFRAWLADYHDTEDVLRPFVLYKLGECYRLTRDYERGVRAYRKIIEMYGGSADPDVKELVELAKLRLDDMTPKAKPPPATGQEPGK